MAYVDNVTKLATQMGISNTPRLSEEDITVSELIFVSGARKKTIIESTEMNRAGRLFFQDLATPTDGRWIGNVILTKELLIAAEEYFAELWEKCPVPGKRKLLDALRDPHNFEVVIVRK